MLVQTNYYASLVILSLLLLCMAAATVASSTTNNQQVIFAINCGGEAHRDISGIFYERDPLNNRVGIASDYGKRLQIGRAHPNDQILYQTERYHTSSFGYDIPLSADGDYVLVLKFSEVYFAAPDQKVFDVVLNGDHTVVPDLDIFDKVGKGIAHDEYVPFTITKSKLHWNGEESYVRGGKVRVDFIKGYKDNPKVNAMFVIKGKMDDVPRLEPLPEHEMAGGNEWPSGGKQEEDVLPKTRRPSGPKMPDPYTLDDSSAMLPIFIALGAFVPFLFCLCKL